MVSLAIMTEFDFDELDEFIKSHTFRKVYMYAEGAIRDGIEWVFKQEHRYAGFMDVETKISSWDGLGGDMIAAQNDKYGHSGWSAAQTVYFVRRILQDNGTEKLSVELEAQQEEGQS